MRITRLRNAWLGWAMARGGNFGEVVHYRYRLRCSCRVVRMAFHAQRTDKEDRPRVRPGDQKRTHQATGADRPGEGRLLNPVRAYAPGDAPHVISSP